MKVFFVWFILFVLGLMMFVVAHFGLLGCTSENGHSDIGAMIIGLLSLLMSSLMTAILSYDSGVTDGVSSFGNAEKKLDLGQTFCCLSKPHQEAGKWFSMVKTGDGGIIAVRFKHKPPEEGVVVKECGKISFRNLAKPPLVGEEVVDSKK